MICEAFKSIYVVFILIIDFLCTFCASKSIVLFAVKRNRIGTFVVMLVKDLSTIFSQFTKSASFSTNWIPIVCINACRWTPILERPLQSFSLPFLLFRAEKFPFKPVVIQIRPCGQPLTSRLFVTTWPCLIWLTVIIFINTGFQTNEVPITIRVLFTSKLPSIRVSTLPLSFAVFWRIFFRALKSSWIVKIDNISGLEYFFYSVILVLLTILLYFVWFLTAWGSKVRIESNSIVICVFDTDI